jgi:hypothetical protein
MTQTSFYEHGNTLFADTFFCGVGGASGTLEAKVAKRNDFGVWGVSVTLFDYADGITHEFLVVSPAGYAELQIQTQSQPLDEDVTVVMAEYEKQYITESQALRLVMTVSELTYLEDIAMPNHYFSRIRFNFEVIAK